MNLGAKHYGRVKPPVNLLPQERQRAIANLRAQGVSIDAAATLGEISRAIARLTLEGGARTKHERVARVRNFIREHFKIEQRQAAPFVPLKMPRQMLDAIARATQPYEKVPGDGR